jgi:GntR family transcriptional regulator/MocR family aminotransferase
MLLYRIYNGYHAPFEDEQTGVSASEERRRAGEALPAPLYADYELAGILGKACAFDPAERYQTPAELREALCRYLARNRGIRVEADQLIIGSGAEYLYGLTVEMLGRDRVWGVESPSYEKIERVYRSRGVVCDLLPLGADGIVSEALQATKASVLHITPFRSFPTGITASASKRQEYLRWVSVPDRFIVEDDYESEFSLLRKPEETVFAATRMQNVIYLNTFSRTVSPSMRVGYMVLPERLVPVFREKVGFYSCSVPAFEQYVLAELLKNGEFERHINRVRRRERKMP